MRGYGLALLVSLLALLLSLFLWPLMTQNPFLLLVLAVAISSWYGGLGPGLLSTFLATLASAYFFLPPTYSLAVHLPTDLLRLGAFTLVALLISSLGAGRRRAEEALREAHNDHERQFSQRTAQLCTANALLNQEIVEHEQAAGALRESEARYRNLFDRVPVGLYRTTPAGQILDANPTMVQMLGYPDRDSLLAANAADLYLKPEDRGQWQALLELEGVARDFEAQLRRRDGTVIWTRDTARAIRDDSGRVLCYEGVIEDITQRKRAEETLQALYRASLQIQEPLGLRERLDRLLNTARDILHIDRLNILLADPNGQWLDGVASLGTKEPAEAMRVPISPEGGGIAQAYLTQQPLIWWDSQSPVPEGIRLQPPYNRLEAFRSRAFAILPLVVRGRAIGVLGADRKHSRLPFDPATLELTKLFATQAALAIDQARLLEEMQHQQQEAERGRREAEAFASLMRDLTGSLELDQVLERLVAHAKALGRADYAFLELVEQDGQTLTVRAQAGLPPSAFEGVRTIKGKGMAGKVLQTGEPLVTTDYLRDPSFSHEYDATAQIKGTRAQAAIPIIHEGTPLGVLLVGRRTSEPLTPTDIQLLTRLADAASLACHHALLYQQANTRAEVLARLWYVDQALSSSLALPETLDRIVQTARDLLRAEYATLTLWDPGANQLTLATHVTRKPLPLRKSLPAGEGLLGTVAATRLPLIVNDYQALPSRLPEQTSVTAGIAVPLLIKDRLLGTLDVGVTESSRTFTAEDLQLLELLAQPAAIALENARLFEEVHLGRERLRTLSRRLVEVQEDERRYVARELHDEVGQILTGLNLVLEMAARGPAKQGRTHLSEAQALVNDLMRRVRELSLDLRPPMLDDLGLLPALLWHFERYTAQTQIQVTLQHAGVDRRFPSEVETAAYRIVQEALTNVARHGRVNKATVRLWADQDRLNMRIEDRGAGFDPEVALAAGRTGGLAGIRERAALLGGLLTVESAPGAGTRVTAELPLVEPVERRRQER